MVLELSWRKCHGAHVTRRISVGVKDAAQQHREAAGAAGDTSLTPERAVLQEHSPPKAEYNKCSGGQSGTSDATMKVQKADVLYERKNVEIPERSEGCVTLSGVHLSVE